MIRLMNKCVFTIDFCFRLYKSVPTIYFPVMWFSLEVEATEKFVNDLKKFLSLPSVCIYAGVIMILVGSLIILTMVVLYLLNRQRATSIAIDKVRKLFNTKFASSITYLRSYRSRDRAWSKRWHRRRNRNWFTWTRITRATTYTWETIENCILTRSSVLTWIYNRSYRLKNRNKENETCVDRMSMLDRWQLTIEGFSLCEKAFVVWTLCWLCELSEDSCAMSFDIYIYISKYREVGSPILGWHFNRILYQI